MLDLQDLQPFPQPCNCTYEGGILIVINSISSSDQILVQQNLYGSEYIEIETK